MKITKVKIKSCDTEIAYLESEAKDSKEVVFKSWDLQAKEFLDALQILKPYVISALELPEDYGETLNVRGLTIKYEEEGIGVVISAIKGLSTLSAPLCINTPYIPPQRNENVTTPMCEDLEYDVEKITEMARKFMQGQYRAQGQLFDEDKK